MSRLDESLKWISDQKTDMLDLLIKLSEQNSGTTNIQGIQQVVSILEKPLAQLEPILSQHKLSGYPDINNLGNEDIVNVSDFIFASKRPDSSRKLLLGGHLDTVYGEEQQEVKIIGEYLYGPGVADMKGGIVVMLFALQAYEKMQIDNKIGWEFFLSSDEEIGSLASKEQLETLAKRHELAFVFEPAVNLKGDISGNRKGSGKFTIVVNGKSAHVGRDFNNGKNAIVMISSMVQEIHSWNTLKDDIIVNVGRIVGGDAVNQVPELAMIKLDVRISNQSIGDWFSSKLETLINEKNKVEGFSVKLHGSFTRPVKTLTKRANKINSKIQEIASKLNQEINIVDTGGCCDGNNLAQHGCIAIDTLGVIGSDIHSKNERMLIDSLVSRAQLTLALIFYYHNRELL